MSSAQPEIEPARPEGPEGHSLVPGSAAPRRELDALRAALAERDRALQMREAESAEARQAVRALQARIDALTAELHRTQQSLGALLGSRQWRALQLVGRVRERLAPVGTWRARCIWYIADVLLRRPKHLRGQGQTERGSAAAAAELRRILDEHRDRQGVVVYPPLVDWGRMKQRPHHLVTQFARAGYLVFFCPPQTRTDFVKLFTRVGDRLYLCGCIEALYDLPEVIALLSKPQHYGWVRYFRQPTLIYECIDDLSVHSPTGHIDRETLARHEELLRTAAVVCATATRLYEEARQIRPDVLFSPNAADFDHFHLAAAPPVPHDLEPILRQGKPVVGYYGALAQWFDFELLHEAARQRPSYNFVLIGPDYDGALQAHLASRPSNVHWLGEKRYDDLPAYLYYFSAATIPFRINPITSATSPIKLYEYLAAGKPVVTTRLPECCRHECVLTAGDAHEFVLRLDEALRRQDDPQYQQGLVNEARANSWEARFAAIHARLVPSNVHSRADVLAELSGKAGVVIFPRSIDWNVDLFQRPHHLARHFARCGFVVIYQGGQRDGHFAGFREIEPNLYVFRGPDEWLHQIPDPLLWCFCYNFDRQDRFPAGTRVVYDLIDQPGVHPFSQRLLKRNHRQALRQATLVTYVAHALERLLRGRPDAIYLPNGVEAERFADESGPLPEDEELKPLRQDGQPVAGYYGALAEWFDYGLLEKLAQRRTDWNFLLIGPDYDQSLARHGLHTRPNVFWLGPRPYAALPAYLRLFDVATIPFRINDITRATSPLKLYEYFAGGKPVITTPMPECQAVPEVRIAQNAEEFSAALDAARAQGQDPAFRARLREIARQNSWEKRVQAVVERLPAAGGRAPQRAPALRTNDRSPP